MRLLLLLLLRVCALLLATTIATMVTIIIIIPGSLAVVLPSERTLDAPALEASLRNPHKLLPPPAVADRGSCFCVGGSLCCAGGGAAAVDCSYGLCGLGS
ncbi:hypothetical protein F5X96DRAFT_609799 [Biscogniauxia mediterranea]|nr:hypothetical protein F5X96DRAFT_609799 [Biscogniauxia mediterranea]